MNAAAFARRTPPVATSDRPRTTRGRQPMCGCIATAVGIGKPSHKPEACHCGSASASNRGRARIQSRTRQRPSSLLLSFPVARCRLARPGPTARPAAAVAPQCRPVLPRRRSSPAAASVRRGSDRGAVRQHTRSQ
jgi:hypothetical protein